MASLSRDDVRHVAHLARLGLDDDEIAQLEGELNHILEQYAVLADAGWHLAKALQVPTNVTLLYLPPYSPELNPVERLWAYLRSHYLSNRVYQDYDELFNASGQAWNQLTPEQLRSICRTGWIPRTNQS